MIKKKNTKLLCIILISVFFMLSPVRISRKIQEIKREKKYQNYLAIQKKIVYSFSFETVSFYLM